MLSSETTLVNNFVRRDVLYIFSYTENEIAKNNYRVVCYLKSPCVLIEGVDLALLVQ